MSAQNIKKANVDREFSVSSSVRMKEAAEKYRVAMSDEKSRDQLIEDYLPLVKSTVSRMRFHFPDHYEIEDMYGIVGLDQKTPESVQCSLKHSLCMCSLARKHIL